MRTLILVFILAFVSNVADPQDIRIYDVNEYGVENIIPSIIIDENPATGTYEVFSVNKYGLKSICPDEIIEMDEYSGTWKVYRVTNYGLQDIIAKKIIEENSIDGSVGIYDVNSLGLRDICPSIIMTKRLMSADIELYSVNKYGIQDISPYEIIREFDNQYEAFSVNDLGLPNIFPDRVMDFSNHSTVFGVMLLPSIRRIEYDPENPTIKAIRSKTATSSESFNNGELLRSKPRSRPQ
jgi:hypothetical protein